MPRPEYLARILEMDFPKFLLRGGGSPCAKLIDLFTIEKIGEQIMVALFCLT